ncbi:hypothetical protein AURDEDRAFT_178752 [Auricularia subglabra TFB-10046 SS5]|uniref:Uncharacterized protein n=1 Tax=Auricularia subglabra (strain TFB-10046 / SS5) TaxID=717982 RepID=J0CPU8_AURST|nr:hypothetical protein AURDEDRAFT_178752 [Auricularia subglabra TFB-10046 SS5]
MFGLCLGLFLCLLRVAIVRLVGARVSAFFVSAAGTCLHWASTVSWMRVVAVRIFVTWTVWWPGGGRGAYEAVVSIVPSRTIGPI